MNEEAIKFICYGMSAGRLGGYCTSAATYEEAISQFKEAAGNIHCMVWMWVSDLPTKAWGHALGITWEGSQERPILIQDNRPAKYKKQSPSVIGSVLSQ